MALLPANAIKEANLHLRLLSEEVAAKDQQVGFFSPSLPGGLFVASALISNSSAYHQCLNANPQIAALNLLHEAEKKALASRIGAPEKLPTQTPTV